MIVDLITIKNKLHTTLFLVIATIIILFYETMLPVSCFLCAVKILHNLYEHKSFTPPKPDVHASIEFIKDCADMIATAKYHLYIFANEVYFWRDPAKAQKCILYLLKLTLITAIGLRLFRARSFIVIIVWASVLYHS